jgi:tyrosyl-tRNA synthetase
MFGKLMSINDTLMARYYLLLLGEEVPGIHPMDAKKQLAKRIVERYHGAVAAQAALDDFTARFSKKDLDHAELPVLSISGLPGDVVSIVVAAYSQCFQTVKSRGDARRLVEQGSVQWNDDKITDPTAKPALQSGDALKLDKKRAVRIG